MREAIEQSRMRIQEFEERQRRVKQEPMENPDVADYRSWQLSNAEVCQVSVFIVEKQLVRSVKNILYFSYQTKSLIW